jgi:F420-non-reducing hydrogenase iron-sulfur subunit
MSDNGFTPHIVCFACNWCSYAGADTAGTSRVQYSPHIRVIRVMCSGRVNPSFVLHSFAKGADGVLVTGCHFGDCHYLFGNHRQVDLFEITKKLVRTIGLEDERIRLEWISAAEGVRFGQVMDEFTEQIKALGKSPVRVALEVEAAAGVEKAPAEVAS